jgi:hypothetical protein
MVTFWYHRGTIVVPGWYHLYAKLEPERYTDEALSSVEKERENKSPEPDQRDHLPAGGKLWNVKSNRASSPKTKVIQNT